MRPAFRLALGLALLMPLSGHAQDITAASAQSIQDQLHAWLAGLLGSAMDPALLTPAVTAEDDHYRLTLPIPGLVGDTTASAKLLPLDHDRWRLQDIKVPPSMHYNVHWPKLAGPEAGGSVAVSIALGSQDAHALIDPALNSRSELDLDLRDLSSRTDGAKMHQQQRIGRYSLTASLQPAQNGRLDLDQSATLTDWSSTTQITGKPPIAFGADRLSMSGRIAGLDRHQAGVLLSAVSGLIATLPANAAGTALDHLNPAERAALHRMVEGLRGIFTSLRGEETADGLHFTMAGKGETRIRHLRFGIGGNAPQGLMHVWLDIAFDGLGIADLPPQTAALVPHHVVLRPSLGGVPADAVMKLALEATEPDANQDQVAAEAEALLMANGVTLGLEKVDFDLGPADVQGTGHITVVGPMQYRGEAHVTATGLDALIDRAHGDPTLQQAIPVLIMLRGFAKPEGDHVVWNVVANGGTVTVNGIELVKPHGPEPGDKGVHHPPSR
jgi:Uncharacterized protein conserved in bacteria (DUF2125)